jgi:hypothetical protein
MTSTFILSAFSAVPLNSFTMCIHTGIRKTSRLSRPYIKFYLFMIRLCSEQATCPANQHKVLKTPKKCVAIYIHTHIHTYTHTYI